MRLYAQTPARRSRQALGDLIAVLLIVAAVALALAVRDAIMMLAEPGRQAENAGDDLTRGLNNVGDAASDVPLLGDSLKKPFQSAAEAGTGLSDAGQSLQDTVTQVADLTALALIVLPVAFVLVLWLPPRLLWMRRSATTRRLLGVPGGDDLLALRALTGPQRDLMRVATPAGGLADAWRRGDPEVVAALSAVALKQAGLRP